MRDLGTHPSLTSTVVSILSIKQDVRAEKMCGVDVWVSNEVEHDLSEDLRRESAAVCV